MARYNKRAVKSCVSGSGKVKAGAAKAGRPAGNHAAPL